MTVETTISAGVLRGSDGAVLSFRGVAYASAGRFERPQPIQPWVGVRDAITPGPAAPQLRDGGDLIPDMAVGEISEDCLRAEIWTPSLEGRRPVLVWIPGGRYQVGSPSLATYDGARLAADGDLVVVGVSYRLGALGFLEDEGIPSNLGLRDLRSALDWIRAEATSFGGDPDRIIVMGESAGAGAITHLLATPGIESVIAGAIVQSGAPGATMSRETASLVAAALCEAANVPSVEHLRTLPLDDLLTAQGIADGELLATVGMMPFHPFVDHDLLPAPPLDAAYAGTLASVPLVIGTTTGEMELFRAQVPALPEDFAIGWLATKLEPIVGAAANPERAAAGLAAAGDLVGAIADTDLHLPAIALADRQTRAGHPVWRYRFDWNSPGIGAAHATDLPFTFGNLDVGDWRSFLGADAQADSLAADALSSEMRQAWASFCHSGAPTSASVGDWPRHDPETLMAVTLGRECSVDNRDADRLRAWTD